MSKGRADGAGDGIPGCVTVDEMKRAALLVALATVTFASGCSKLAALAQDQDTAADGAAATTPSAPTAATTAPAAATAAAVTSAKPIPGSTAVAAKNAKHPLVAPSPTTDRFARNRDKDGPCPVGFVEQPGVEEHSSCARACKTDATCHGHTCVDSDVGKVCSDIASKTTAASAAKPALKCKANEFDDGERCVKTCGDDKDCAGLKGTSCQMIRVPNPNGGTSAQTVCLDK
jgi:hypothetical protein